jgi:hypothetical protein
MAMHGRPKSRRQPEKNGTSDYQTREWMSVYRVNSQGSLGITLPKVVRFHLEVGCDDSVEIQLHEDGIWIPCND